MSQSAVGAIIVQDRLSVASGNLDALLALFHAGYIESASRRGLRLLQVHTSPGVRCVNEDVLVWLRWEVADVGAWWAMRAQSGTPEIAAFWGAVDALCSSRERRYLTEGTPPPAQAGTELANSRVTFQGYRETAQLRLRDALSERDKAELNVLLQRAGGELPQVAVNAVGTNVAPDYAAGDITWDLLFADAGAADGAHASAWWQNALLPTLARCCSEVHALVPEAIEGGLRRPDLTAGIKRTAFFRLLPDTNAQTARRFERDLLEMPQHIPDILNWRLSRATPASWHRADCEPWSYVWEQEFADLSGLTGPYMIHPFHWAHVDRWFDVESGGQAVDARLSHAFSPLDESLLAQEAR